MAGISIHLDWTQVVLHRTLSKHLELCASSILDCPGFNLLSEET